MMQLADLAIVADANAVLAALAARLGVDETRSPDGGDGERRCLTSTSSWSAPARPVRPRR